MHKIGFAWLPLWFIKQQNNSEVVELKLDTGHVRTVALQLAVRPELASSKVVKAFVSYVAEE